MAFFGAHAGLHGAHFATGAAQLGFALQHFGLLDLHKSSLGMLIFGMHSLGSSSFGRQTFGSSIFGSLNVGQPQSPADAGALRATRAARDRIDIASFFMRLSPCDLFEGNEQGHRLPFHGTSESRPFFDCRKPTPGIDPLKFFRDTSHRGIRIPTTQNAHERVFHCEHDSPCASHPARSLRMIPDAPAPPLNPARQTQRSRKSRLPMWLGWSTAFRQCSTR